MVRSAAQLGSRAWLVGPSHQERATLHNVSAIPIFVGIPAPGLLSARPAGRHRARRNRHFGRKCQRGSILSADHVT
jgi:hypothetical protein